jgi:hypothetical protein
MAQQSFVDVGASLLDEHTPTEPDCFTPTEIDTESDGEVMGTQGIALMPGLIEVVDAIGAPLLSDDQPSRVIGGSQQRVIDAAFTGVSEAHTFTACESPPLHELGSYSGLNVVDIQRHARITRRPRDIFEGTSLLPPSQPRPIRPATRVDPYDPFAQFAPRGLLATAAASSHVDHSSVSFTRMLDYGTRCEMVRHCVSVIDERLQRGSGRFYIGITRDPIERWEIPSHGHWREHRSMWVLLEAAPTRTRSIEVQLEETYRGNPRLLNMPNTPCGALCPNERGMHFLYVCWARW